MKYCDKVMNHLYVGNCNGDVRLCAWQLNKNGVIGNLLEQDLYTIWHSEKAQEIRNKVMNGCFDNCSNMACHYIQRNELPDKTDDISDIVNNMPSEINLSYDFTCNLSCPSCRNGIFKQPKGYSERLDKIYSNMKDCLNNVKILDINGRGEVFASEHSMKILENLKPVRDDFTLILETNGQLFDEEHFKKIAHLGKYYIQVNLSIDSLDENTYSVLRRGGKLDNLLKNLEYISKLRSDNIINTLVSVLVIQDSNFKEIPRFIEYSINTLGCDKVFLEPIYNAGAMTHKQFFTKDVLNPANSHHKEYLEILKHPSLKLPQVFKWGGDTLHERYEYDNPIIVPPETNLMDSTTTIMKCLKDLNESDFNLANWLVDSNKKNICIYGIGRVGKVLIDLLENEDVNLGILIDNNEYMQSIGEYKIVTFDEVSSFDDVDIIFITPFYDFDCIYNDFKDKHPKNLSKVVNIKDWIINLHNEIFNIK